MVDKFMLIDCGVPFKYLFEDYKELKIVMLTHIHSDHFNKSTVKRLAKERPALRWACGKWMVAELIKCGVNPAKIDILDYEIEYDYGSFHVIPVYLKHNVPNMGFKFHFSNGKKLFYATDFNNFNGIFAKNYDLYLVEANYTEEEINQRIENKRLDGKYCYEYQVKQNHMSKEKCDDWLYKNMGARSEFRYMHIHKTGKKETQEIS